MTIVLIIAILGLVCWNVVQGTKINILARALKISNDSLNETREEVQKLNKFKRELIRKM